MITTRSENHDTWTIGPSNARVGPRNTTISCRFASIMFSTRTCAAHACRPMIWMVAMPWLSDSRDHRISEMLCSWSIFRFPPRSWIIAV
jgi:hypothetical protein